MSLALATDALDVSIELVLLARFELRCQGHVVELPTAARRLLAFLALQDRPVSRSFVAGSLWVDATEERATANLRSSLWRIPPDARSAVTANGTHMALQPDVWVDVRAAHAVARGLVGREGRDDGDGVPPDRWLLTLDLLPDWYDEWVIVERERLRHLRLHALEALGQALTEQGRFGEAVEAGLAAIAGDPLRESAHRTLISTHLAEGNYADAVRQFHTFRELLRDEMRLAPSPEMAALVRHLLRPGGPGAPR